MSFRLVDLSKNFHLVEDLANLYVEIFSEAPYFEKYEANECVDEFKKYILDGTIYVVYDNGVKGFVFLKSGENLNLESEFRYEIGKYICYEKSIYIDEFAIDSRYRGKGIGTTLIKKILSLEEYRDHDFFLRTNLMNNDNVINFYQKAGFHLTPIVKSVKTKSLNSQDQVDDRVYMILKTRN